MFFIVKSATIFGLDPIFVDVEISSQAGVIPSFEIIGLANKSLEEAKHRLLSSLSFLDIKMKAKKYVINLAPADVKKQGSSIELGMAVGFLLENKRFFLDTKHTLYIGELSLNGSIRPISGILSILLQARSKGFERVVLPKANFIEARAIEDLDIIPIESLRDLVDESDFSKIKAKNITHIQDIKIEQENKNNFVDLGDILDQTLGKKAIILTASGGHNLLMVGPPGCGKTMLARSIKSILPDLTKQQSIEVTKIHSIKGLVKNKLIKTPPYREVHHSITYPALIGGGRYLKPGEISLAHKGVLYMDEFLEFRKQVIEALRQPLESLYIKIDRAIGSVVYPADFFLIASSNPCPCGWYKSKTHKCTCSLYEIKKYRSKLSGPILDRFDILIRLNEVDIKKIIDRKKDKFDSNYAKNLVLKARDRQKYRFKNNDFLNARIPEDKLKEYIKLTNKASEILKDFAIKFKISARSLNKILKLSLTIMDIEGKGKINEDIIFKAFSFRNYVQD